MENQRTLLYLALVFILFLMWQAWQKDYGPKPVEPVTSSQTASSGEEPAAVNEDIPSPVVSEQQASVQAADTETAQSQRVHVKTDLMDVEIDTRGGDVRQLTLTHYPTSTEDPEPFILFSEQNDIFHVAQSGLVSSNSSAPTHHAIYHADQLDYQLTPGVNELKVVLTWQDAGVTVKKVFTFQRDSYVIGVEHHVISDSPWTGSQYRQLVRSDEDPRNKSTFIHTFTGGVIYNADIKYQKIKFDNLAKAGYLKEIGVSKDMKGGWIAMIQHYFMSAWVPLQDQSNFAYNKHPSEHRYILGLRSPAKSLKAGEEGVFTSELVVGPKLQDRLEKIAPGLDLVVDYGYLTILAKPLFWVLEMFHKLFNNWGWAIIFLTMSVKLVFFKLSETSYRSMAKMRKLGPRLQTLKERYGDDKQRMSQAMMSMYKEEKINPLGGCLPIVIQIPVFIALYWVLLESVEMRNAPFALWINNLSAKDPYYVLPIIYGITMFIQQRLNPAPMDPMQKRMFQIMPVMFTAFFFFFPAGLVLYWVVNNSLSIAQQWVITRRIAKE